jgi:ABC-type amino acid transport system permease subunit
LTESQPPKASGAIPKPSIFLTATIIDSNEHLSSFSVPIVVLRRISSAYQPQIQRGEILTIPDGQMKAARYKS